MKKIFYSLIAILTLLILSCSQPEEEKEHSFSLTIQKWPENVESIIIKNPLDSFYELTITEAGSYPLEKFGSEAIIQVAFNKVIYPETWTFYNYFGYLIDEDEHFKIFLKNSDSSPKTEIQNKATPEIVTPKTAGFNNIGNYASNIICNFIGTFNTSDNMTISFENSPRKIERTEVKLSEQEDIHYIYIDTTEPSERFEISICDKNWDSLPQIVPMGLYVASQNEPEIRIRIHQKEDYEITSDNFIITPDDAGPITQTTNNEQVVIYIFEPVNITESITLKITGGETNLIDDKNFFNKKLTLKSYGIYDDTLYKYLPDTNEEPAITNCTITFSDKPKEEDKYRTLYLRINNEEYEGNWYLTSETDCYYKFKSVSQHIFFYPYRKEYEFYYSPYQIILTEQE